MRLSSDKEKCNPFFSVIIPMYNSMKVIDNTIESVLKQTFKDIEIIIVDNASTDRSYDYCKKYLANNIYLYRNETNKGVSYSRNFALSKAAGEYVLFLDSDDQLMPNSLEEICKILSDSQPDMLYSCEYYSGKSIEEKKISGYGMKVSNREWLTENLMDRINMFVNTKFIFAPWNKIYRLNFLRENDIRFDVDIQHAEDMLLTFRCIYLAEKIYLVNNRFYFYRVNDESVSHNLVMDNVVDNLMKYPLVLKAFFEKYHEPKLTKEWKARIINFFISHNMEFNFHRAGAFSKPIWKNDIKSSYATEYALLSEVEGNKFGEHEYIIRFLMSECMRYHREEEKRDMISTQSEEYFYFPYHLFKQNDRVLIYGAGNVGRQFYQQGNRVKYVQIVGIVDKNNVGDEKDKIVSPLSAIKTLMYDYILIAIKDENIAEQIKAYLINEGIPSEKIKWDGFVYEEKDFYHRRYLPMLDYMEHKI